ncbi:hypothetical protein GCM10009853_031000 [Glycomyces scopariae]
MPGQEQADLSGRDLARRAAVEAQAHRTGVDEHELDLLLAARADAGPGGLHELPRRRVGDAESAGLSIKLGHRSVYYSHVGRGRILVS